jgi:hypothetical protein
LSGCPSVTDSEVKSWRWATMGCAAKGGAVPGRPGKGGKIPLPAGGDKLRRRADLLPSSARERQPHTETQRETTRMKGRGRHTPLPERSAAPRLWHHHHLARSEGKGLSRVHPTSPCSGTCTWGSKGAPPPYPRHAVAPPGRDPSRPQLANASSACVAGKQCMHRGPQPAARVAPDLNRGSAWTSRSHLEESRPTSKPLAILRQAARRAAG